MTETQQRFLKAISERITSGEVEEIRLYPTVRAGHLESGVAIVAVRDLAPATDSSGSETAEAPGAEPAIVEATDTVPAEAASGTEQAGAVADEAASTDQPAGDEPVERIDEAIVVDESAVMRSDKLSILTAHFRQQVKGPERGKWEFEMVHDADAPLETIERVVRGVAHRAGEDGEPELLTGDEFRRALTEPWWTAQT